jgi:hypothetical protein
VWQTRAAESRSKLNSILECLLIIIVSIFNGDGVVTLTDFAALLLLAFTLYWYIFKLWGRGWIRDELHNVILQYTTCCGGVAPRSKGGRLCLEMGWVG